MEEMPRKSADELEQECLRILRGEPSTRDITSVKIVRLATKGSGPNWTHGTLEPPPTPYGFSVAHELIAGVAGRWALVED